VYALTDWKVIQGARVPSSADSAQSNCVLLRRGFLVGRELRALRRYVLGLRAFTTAARSDASCRNLSVYRETVGARTGFPIRVESFSNDCLRQTGIDLFERCRPVARQCLARDLVPFKDKINIRWPGDAGYAAHQDAAAGWNKYATSFVTVVLFLADSNPAAGGFQFASERCPERLLPHENGRLHDTAFEALERLDVYAEAGDAIVFDGLAPHRSHSNASSGPRAHVLLTYCDAADEMVRRHYFDDKTLAMRGANGEFEFRLFSFAPTDAV